MTHSELSCRPHRGKQYRPATMLANAVAVVGYVISVTGWWWWSRASCPRMSVDILGTNCDQCRSMVQCCFTSTETVRLIMTESPGRPPRLSHSSWTLCNRAGSPIRCNLWTASQTRFQARSRDLRGGRWSWKIKLAQKRSWVGRWSWAAKAGLLSLRVVQVVRQQQCNGHCFCDSAQTQQLKQQLRSAQVTGQWRGDTALTLPLFWRRSTVSPVSFGWYSRSSLHSFDPSPPPIPPVPNKPPRFRGRKAT